jgi:hypothetical protein
VPGRAGLGGEQDDVLFALGDQQRLAVDLELADERMPRGLSLLPVRQHVVPRPDLGELLAAGP